MNELLEEIRTRNGLTDPERLAYWALPRNQGGAKGEIATLLEEIIRLSAPLPCGHPAACLETYEDDDGEDLEPIPQPVTVTTINLPEDEPVPRDGGTVVMTDEELQAIRRRCAKATPGPWVISTSWQNPDVFTARGIFLADSPEGTIASWQIVGGYPDDPPEGFQIIGGEITSGEVQPEDDDLAFVAHSRQDIPALLTELDRLRAENAALRTEGGIRNAAAALGLHVS